MHLAVLRNPVDERLVEVGHSFIMMNTLIMIQSLIRLMEDLVMLLLKCWCCWLLFWLFMNVFLST